MASSGDAGSLPFESTASMPTSLQPLILPVELSISKIKLDAIVSVYASAGKGIALSFCGDPLDSIGVSSSFDDTAFIKQALQSEIEGVIRKLLLHELPEHVHAWSLSMLGELPEFMRPRSRTLSSTSQSPLASEPGSTSLASARLQSQSRRSDKSITE